MILEFAYKFDAKWEYFTEEWIQEQFGIGIANVPQYTDVLVTVIK
jgi:Ni,Fe-hydrogenase III small subunit